MLAFSYETSQGRMLVLSGSAEDHRRLSDALRALASQPQSTSVKLREVGLLKNDSNLEIVVQVAPKRNGARMLLDNEALWLIDERRLPDFAELVAVLAETEGAGHQYLDGDNDLLTVKASKDEYEKAWIEGLQR
jgi:hypothetical protein